MAGLSKRFVAMPDQGSVQDYCERLGITYASVARNQSASFQTEYHDMMQALTGLAYAEDVVTKHWKERVTWHIVNDGAHDKLAYEVWCKLDRVKEEVFGPGWSPKFDAPTLIAHPWALSPDDFKKTYDALTAEQLPLNLPQQRTRSSVTFDWLTGFLGAGAGASMASPLTAPAAPVLGIASAGAWGLGQLAGVLDDATLRSKLAQVRSHIPDLIPRYTREAELRAKLTGQAPTLTSSNAVVRLGL